MIPKKYIYKRAFIFLFKDRSFSDIESVPQLRSEVLPKWRSNWELSPGTVMKWSEDPVVAQLNLLLCVQMNTPSGGVATAEATAWKQALPSSELWLQAFILLIYQLCFLIGDRILSCVSCNLSVKLISDLRTPEILQDFIPRGQLEKTLMWDHCRRSSAGLATSKLMMFLTWHVRKQQ